jgi:L-2-hydroxyglutarate oxidase LhgO
LPTISGRIDERITSCTDVDCTVVGAGVIGLAVARALAQHGYSVMIIEREPTIGSGISSRNSEVIHAGIYYTHGSLKAKFCVEGNSRLYAFCREHRIDHRRCGKLIVATDHTQLTALEQLAQAATANGVLDLQWLDRDAAQKLEPQLQCVAALLSFSTGIVDTHALMLALLGDAERAGANLALNTEIVRARYQDDGIDLFIATSAVATEQEPALRTRWLINCAGLGAITFARNIEPLPAAIPSQHFAKGSYFSLQGATPFSRLIYPLPEPGGLGVHLTLDLAGRARFGPDVEWIDAPDYRVDPNRAEMFYKAIRRYWPRLHEGQLVPAYAGIRPKISGPETIAADFRIDGPDEHGVPGLINLFGIESPGLTSALPLADAIVALVTTQ